MIRQYNPRLFTQISEDLLQSFYDNDQFEWVDELEDSYSVILDEYNRNVDSALYIEYPEKKLHDGNWTIIPMIHKGKMFMSEIPKNLFIDPHKHFPNLMLVLDRIFGQKLQTVGFSKLKSNTKIKPHKGLPDNTLRLHLGIDVPEGDCWLRVKDDCRQWQSGKVMIFDDRVDHEVWNNTNRDRVVLLLDFIYDGPNFFEPRKRKLK